MINLSNTNIDSNLESKKTFENETNNEMKKEHNLHEEKEKDSVEFTNNENNLIENMNEGNINSIISNVIEKDETITDANNSEDKSNTLEDNTEVSNCLALTVKKDYSMAVVKNVFVRTVKGIWKVAVSIFTLNIIKFFL